jgi:hypothetical protein
MLYAQQLPPLAKDGLLTTAESFARAGTPAISGTPAIAGTPTTWQGSNNSSDTNKSRDSNNRGTPAAAGCQKCFKTPGIRRDVISRRTEAIAETSATAGTSWTKQQH